VKRWKQDPTVRAIVTNVCGGGRGGGGGGGGGGGRREGPRHPGSRAPGRGRGGEVPDPARIYSTPE